MARSRPARQDDRFQSNRVFAPRAVDADYFGFTTGFTRDKAYALSCDFDRERLEQLLRFLPDPIMARWLADQFARKFDEPVLIDVPQIDIGLEARLGDAQDNGQETWVPLIVSSFFEPTELVKVTYLDRDEADAE